MLRLSQGYVASGSQDPFGSYSTEASGLGIVGSSQIPRLSQGPNPLYCATVFLFAAPSQLSLANQVADALACGRVIDSLRYNATAQIPVHRIIRAR